jgi:hypothetical protein
MNTLMRSDGIKLLSKHITETGERHGGHYCNFHFPNEFGASLIRTEMSYGGEEGLFEIAVLNANGTICYKTEITDDVIGYLDKFEVVSTLIAIKNL